MDIAKKHFFDYLTKNNLKLTNPRSVIFDVFWKTEEHITPEDLFFLVKTVDKSIGKATVYRTLKLFSESGVASEIDFGDGIKRYEPSFGKEHHDHLICVCCGKSIEIVCEKIEYLQEKLAKENNFILTGHSMCLYGKCSDCMKKCGDCKKK